MTIGDCIESLGGLKTKCHICMEVVEKNPEGRTIGYMIAPVCSKECYVEALKIQIGALEGQLKVVKDELILILSGDIDERLKEVKT